MGIVTDLFFMAAKIEFGICDRKPTDAMVIVPWVKNCLLFIVSCVYLCVIMIRLFLCQGKQKVTTLACRAGPIRSCMYVLYIRKRIPMRSAQYVRYSMSVCR